MALDFIQWDLIKGQLDNIGHEKDKVIELINLFKLGGIEGGRLNFTDTG